MRSTTQPLGRRFLIVWAGQSVSEIGTMLSGVAAAVYIYLETGSATWLGVISALTALPAVLMGAAGAIIDRYPRRSVMIWADVVAAAAPLLALTLALAGRLEIWHLVVAGFVASLGNAAQIPASHAAIPALVEPEQLERAHSLRQLSTGVSVVVGPIAATPILIRWGIEAVLLVDLATFVVGISATILIRFADPGEDSTVKDDGSWRDMWSWLRGPGALLFTLMAMGAALSLTVAFFNIAILVSATVVAGAAKVGLVLGLGGFAMIAGSIVSAGRPPSNDRGARIAGSLAIVAVGFVVSGLRPTIWIQAVGVAIALSAIPAVSASFAAIFNERVPPQMQGRVFALRGSVAEAMQSIGALVAGIAIAYIAEPAMRSGALTNSLGRVMGTGPSSGAGLVLVGTGISIAVIGIWLFRSPIRDELRTSYHEDETLPPGPAITPECSPSPSLVATDQAGR